jgi:FkbM family methyltransferase
MEGGPLMREWIPDLLTRVPPFNRPEARYAFVRRRAKLGRVRRRTYERLGSARWSRPALYEMDGKLEPYLGTGGVFVEAGANDGYLQSNTYYLERFRGWTGVLVEPIPELYELCIRERPRSKCFNCALVPDNYAEPVVHMRYGGLMSLVEGAQGSEEADAAHALAGNMLGWDKTYEVDVPARTLTSVLQEAEVGEFDFLSLDVEGFEASVLRGLDLERHAPWLLLVELVDVAKREELEAVLGGRYEERDRLSPFDVLYERR